MTSEHNDGAFAEYIVARAAGVAPPTRGARPPSRRVGRAALGCPARHYPLSDRAGRQRHGVRCRSHRCAQRRGAARHGHRPTSRPSSRTRADASSPPPWARRRSSTPPSSRCSRRGSPNARPPGPRMSCWSARGTGRRSRRAFCQVRRGGILVMVGAGIDHPTFDINRMILNELTVTGSFIYDLGGFERALEMLASDGFPADQLIEPGTHRARWHRRRAGGSCRRKDRGQGDGRPGGRRPDGTPLLFGWQSRASTMSPCRCRPTCSARRAGPTSAPSSKRSSGSTRSPS